MRVQFLIRDMEERVISDIMNDVFYPKEGGGQEGGYLEDVEVS